MMIPWSRKSLPSRISMEKIVKVMRKCHYSKKMFRTLQL